MKQVYADSTKIKWLLENFTPYYIHKHTSVSQSNINDLKRGKRKIENLSIAVGAKLTELAIKEQETTQE
ncbi:hypothetical protein ACS127_03345 [Amphibacillus sp. Q70]|uniref:hypothetical protein n=1 Tax=Amphibacillus sp. Q70 TaxID=3453416 RepID=UPI003F871F15